MKKPMKRSIQWTLAAVLVFVLVLSLAAAGPVRAAEIDQDGQVAAGEVVDDDLFLSGDKAVMAGTVNGSLFASGNTLTVSGTVRGDAFLTGNRIIVAEGAVIEGNVFMASSYNEVAGQVNGSVFGAGAVLVIKPGAEISGNAYSGSYALILSQGSKIGRDLFAGAYQATLSGEVGRDAKLGAAAVQIDGRIGRDVTLSIGEPEQGGSNPGAFMQFIPALQGVELPAEIPAGIAISEAANIGGKLSYESTQDLSAGIRATPAGGVVHTIPEVTETAKPVEKTPTFLSWLIKAVRSIVTLLLLGLLAVWKLPALLRRVVDQARNRVWPSAGHGFVTVIIGYLLAVLAAGVVLSVGLVVSLLTLGGLSRVVFGLGFSSLALGVTAFGLLVTYGSKLVVAYWAGEAIVGRLAAAKKEKPYLVMAVGVLVYGLLASLPYIGWIAALFGVLVGMGAMWLVWRSWRYSRRNPPVHI